AVAVSGLCPEMPLLLVFCPERRLPALDKLSTGGLPLLKRKCREVTAGRRDRRHDGFPCFDIRFVAGAMLLEEGIE
ncbi:hypothetical protein ACXIVK_37960, partial [Paraburkholderia caledonica]